jgi:hypothetical protein
VADFRDASASRQNSLPSRNEEIAKITLSQMGGAGKLESMINARNFAYGSSGLTFRFSGSSKADWVVVKLNGNDTYDMTFYKAADGKYDIREAGKIHDVYNDQLQNSFEDFTGLKLSLAGRRPEENAETLSVSNGAIGRPDSTGNTYEERIALKKQRYKELADKKRLESDSAFERANQMSSVIPLGQPILVGHYSEKSDRNYRNRIQQTMRKGIDLEKQADYYARKAESAGTGGISQDDPEAVNKLREKISYLEKQNETMKRYNALVRKGSKAEAMNLLDDRLKREVDSYSRFSNSQGLFPSFALSNNTGKIRQARERIKMLEQQGSRQFSETRKSGYSVIEDPAINRLQIKFDNIPSDRVRNVLKSNGFRWSPTNGVWQSYLNNRSMYALTKVEEELKAEQNKVM